MCWRTRMLPPSSNLAGSNDCGKPFEEFIRREGFKPQVTEISRGKCLDNCSKLCFSPLPPSAIMSLR
eukprot:TRINITY_DN2372_c0_g1_i1.p2 TRINITY_DN2372_c0_g1~~TRINITY_DN2372_c0_g1_i1.p2  ORF type:complete len:67 (-),score=0.04 TRINITY_DN2372_c0_g1_i1:159-359(-)